MAVRLQMKLGFVTEQDRLPDSPDVIVCEEPAIGAVMRSKGNLYLLVTASTVGARSAEATALVADTIRREYFYDESAGIVGCLAKAIRTANKKVVHQRDRLDDDETNGPIGVAAAVVRGNELYVVTVGPAEAYLIRQARLSTLPDPHRDRGLPTTELEPDVWRGEIAVGDSVVLVSPNLVASLGPDELKDAMVTLHPQSAMEHLHHRFVAAGGSGSDGAIAFEAIEVSATTRQRKLVPVRPQDRLAGSPDRSPIPLADSVSGGVAAVQQSARQAGTAASSLVGRILGRIQDRMPRRSGLRDRRVTTQSGRRETQRRAAVAVLALVAVVASLGLGVWWLGGHSGTPSNLGSLTAGQRALQKAHEDIGTVYADGVNLVQSDPGRAMQLLSDAWTQLKAADAAGVKADATGPLRTQARSGLDDLFKMRTVSASVLFSFGGVTPAVSLTAVVLGPDGAPYVLDSANQVVYRIDLRSGKAAAILKAGQTVSGLKVGAPLFLARSAADVLILDAKNVVWRWRPANKTGAGTPARVSVHYASSWGNDIRAFGTFDRGGDQGLYNIYVVDPSESQILLYTPASDGSGFPGKATNWLLAPQDVSKTDAILIDGDLYLSRGGTIARFTRGASSSWTPGDPGDELLRAAPAYTIIATGSLSGTGVVYGYDRANGRILAISKNGGSITEQYELAGADPGWADMRGMYVVAAGPDLPATLVWVDHNRLVSSPLIAVQNPNASPAPSTSPGSSPLPSATPTKRPKATKKP